MNTNLEYKGSPLDVVMHLSLAAVIAVSVVVMAVWLDVQAQVI